jgi:hypothetical protein
MARAACARSCTRATRTTCAATASSAPRAAAAVAVAGRPAIPARARTTSSSTLSKEEFMQVFFEDLALPHLMRTQLAEVPEWKSHRAGFSSDGTPNNLHVVRSDAWRHRPAHRARAPARGASLRELRSAVGRDAGLTLRARRRPSSVNIAALEEEIAALRHARRAHPLPRPDRPALPQPRQGAGAHQQGGDVLPDGRVGLDGRRPQGAEPSASSSCCTCS